MPPELPMRIAQFVANTNTALPANSTVFQPQELLSQQATTEQHTAKILRLNKLSHEPAGTPKHVAAIEALRGMVFRVHGIQLTSRQAESVLLLLDDLQGIPSSDSEAFKQLVQEVMSTDYS